MRLIFELGWYYFFFKKSNVLKELLVELDVYSKIVLFYFDFIFILYRLVDLVIYDRLLYVILVIV